MIPREVSSKALEYLITREGGMQLSVYDDGFGYLTVGVGHLVMDEDRLSLGDTISEERAKAFLQDDLLEAREAVTRVGLALRPHEYDALVIFCFNIGATAFRRSTLVRRLRQAPLNTRCVVVKEELPRWKKVGGQTVVGLYNRRIDTAQMFCDADYTVNWQGLEGQISSKA